MAGIKSIPMKVLKSTKQPISNNLSKIFNLSFSVSIFPGRLKTVMVRPISKKGSKFECSNYRPISLLSNIDKFIENAISKWL